MGEIPNHDLPIGHLDECQLCASGDLELILDLGHHPPCDSLLLEKHLNEMERTYPNRFKRCRVCGLAQIDYAVAPEELFFAEYPYRSGITGTLANNLKNMAVKVTEKYDIPPGSLAMDIGSNDGTVLQGFKSKGLRVLGVEPTNIARIAIEEGIPTEQEFFSEELAQRIVERDGNASVVTACNMFAHVTKLGDLIRGVRHLLVDGGIFLTESHYVLALLDTVQYDSIYHEHLKYYSVKSLVQLYDYYDFTVVDAERIPNYGGSIRVYAQKGRGRPVSENIPALLNAEEELGLNGPATYHQFREKALEARAKLQYLIVDLNRRGKRVVGIGCPGRSSTLLNFCGIGPELMPYIAEQSTSLKLGMFLPGRHIPIVDEKIMFEEQPEYAVMLSWHYAEPILRKLREKGLRSKIILPLPEVRILEE